MNSDQGYSSVYVNWTKQVCLQTRLKWWEWWGTPDIIWNRVPDRRRSKRKWTITKCCLTLCRSIEKRHGVWAGASVAGVQWLFMQHISDIWWCSTAVTVVAQTSYFVSASYHDRKPMKWYNSGNWKWYMSEHLYKKLLAFQIISFWYTVVSGNSQCYWIESIHLYILYCQFGNTPIPIKQYCQKIIII